MIREKNLTATSKFLSLVLRHQPEVVGMQLDDVCTECSGQTYPDGTLVMSRLKGRFGNFLSRATETHYTHTAIVIDGKVCESTFPRAKCTPINRTEVGCGNTESSTAGQCRSIPNPMPPTESVCKKHAHSSARTVFRSVHAEVQVSRIDSIEPTRTADVD